MAVERVSLLVVASEGVRLWREARWQLTANDLRSIGVGARLDIPGAYDAAQLGVRRGVPALKSALQLLLQELEDRVR